MSKSPAFQFYAADFDMDTGSWTAPQVGVYVRLLMSAWVNGGLPNNMAEIARIARIDARTLAKMWKATLAKKWTLTPENMYVNPRLELERQKQQNYKEKQRLKGKIRAEKMWKDHIAVAKNRLQPEDSSSSSSSSSSKILDHSIILDSNSNSAVKPPRFDFEIQEIIKFYHKYLPGCPVVRDNGTLPKIIRRRLTEKKDRQELIWWQEYFQYVALSDFLTGKKTDFIADLEWLIGPKNMQKVLNGRYHRDQKNGCSGIDEWVRINREKFAREEIENGKES